ncbi:MAG: M48 family metallopeptidase [Nitrosomonas sp.]|nr:M48 family metallopeptidase [Nitrosomonas sp.]MDP1951655.1 M48 family metallopeptidase [Nitrosomonas sp.]
MNFFKAQDHARQSTFKLVVLFSLAVFALILFTNLLVMFALGYVNTDQLTAESFAQQFDGQTFLLIGSGVLVTVLFGSLYKINSLGGSGAKVAEMMGAELIVASGGDINKQKVLHVVEEMAIASGTPVPPVYLLPEDSINAFAAGNCPSNAVIGITRGCIEKLSRDELQGVIAHEFSHILNGDMRLNIRLIGILHGILLLGIIGYYLLRVGGHSRNSKNNGGIVFLALGLIVIGYGGTFFGNLIKAAVNRQREYLADASAVQFTRNPGGVAGALKRIGSDAMGSIIQNPHGVEISHALFSEGMEHSFTRLFATHPPLEKRIRNIEPNWNGKFEYKPVIEVQLKPAAQSQAQGVKKAAALMAGAAAVMRNEGFVDRVGQLSSGQIDYAQQLLSELPAEIKQAAHNPFAARALIYFMVLDNDPEMRQQQLQYLASAADEGVYAETIKLVKKIPQLALAHRLPLLDMALSTLRQLSKRQYLVFKDNLNALVAMDDKILLFEWSLQKILFHHLDVVFGQTSKQKTGQLSLKQTQPACAVVLSFLIYADKQQGMSNEAVFAAAREKLEGLDIELLPVTEISLDQVGESLDQLARLTPLKKPLLLKACAKAIVADQQITAAEVELFRAIADLIDCPMPPLVA